MSEYTKEFLEQLKVLCLSYDEEYGKYPDPKYIGKDVYSHALGILLGDEEYFDD